MKRKKKRSFIVHELVQSERTYCENLEFIIKEIMIPSKTYIKDRDMHGYLFSNIEQIFALHSNFLSKLEELMKFYKPFTTKLSKVLLEELFNKDDFKKAYSNYCYNYKTTDQAIKVLVKDNVFFVEHLKKIGLETFNLTLESYMIKPVQRLCKYGLIIGDYFRNMDQYHIDFVDIEMTSILIDKMVNVTNDQVEEFLMRESLEELKRTYPLFF